MLELTPSVRAHTGPVLMLTVADLCWTGLLLTRVVAVRQYTEHDEHIMKIACDEAKYMYCTLHTLQERLVVCSLLSEGMERGWNGENRDYLDRGDLENTTPHRTAPIPSHRLHNI